jgi:hypothetical protein
LGYAKQDYNFNIEKTSSNFKVGLNLKVKWVLR